VDRIYSITVSMLKQNRVLFIFQGVLILTFILLVITYDRMEILVGFNDWREQPWISVFRLTTLIGEPFSYVLVFFILLFVRLRYAIMVPVIGLSTAIITYLLKVGFSAPRPVYMIKNEGLIDQFRLMDGVPLYEGYTSFPSGHTFAAFSLFIFLALVLPWKKITPIVCVFLALSVGISRIYLLHHFAHDVLFGMVLGVAVAIIMYLLQEVHLSHIARYDRSIGFSRK
jgi:membrane-associated phospholipid phosphatase